MRYDSSNSDNFQKFIIFEDLYDIGVVPEKVSYDFGFKKSFPQYESNCQILNHSIS